MGGKKKYMVEKKKSNILVAAVLNLIFVVIEIIGGIYTGSVAILSDSVHDLGDSLTLFVAYFLERKSDKKPDKKYTYGYLRYSLLGAIITALTLIIGSIVIIYNAVIRIMNPIEINYKGMIFFAIIGLLVNIIGFKLTHKTSNMNEKMISFHLLEDTLNWILVIAVSIIMMFTDAVILDAILSIVISLYIFTHVIANLKRAIEIMLDKAPENIDIDKLTFELKEKFNIIGIHHVHLWSLDGENNFITMHIVVRKDESVEKIINLKKEIKHELLHNGINHTTLEIEYDFENCNDIICDIKNDNEGHHHH